MFGLLLALGASYVKDVCVAPTNISPPPANMTIKLVEVVTRHGSRVPTKTFLTRPKRGAWLCDSEQAIATRFNAIPQVRPRRVHNIIDPRVADYPPNCRAGDLTLDGMLQHHELGISFHKYLIEEQQFLPKELDNGIMYIHSTNRQRTYDSALSFLQGLYPPISMNEIITIESGVTEKDYFHPETASCAEYKEMKTNYSSTPEFKKFLADTIEQAQPIFDALGVTSTKYSDINNACDYALTFWCNNISFGQNITEDMIHVCRKYVGSLMGVMYRTNPGIATSPAMREIFRIMDESLGGEKPTKFALLSSHDTTIAGLLAMMDYSEELGPPYASYLMFEVLEDNNSKELHIRVVFNGKDIPLVDGRTCVTLHEFREKIGPLLGHCPEFE